MTTLRPDLPPPSAPNFDQRLRETMMTYLGKQGDKLDRGITLRDLVDNQLVTIAPGYNAGNIGSGRIPLVPGLGVLPPYERDLTPPPMPTGFTLSAAISHLFIEHAPPVFTAGHGYLRTNVYAAVYTGGALPVFGGAVRITQFSGTVFAHAVNPATTFYVWVTWESRDGVESAPAGGTNGLAVTTGQDVTKLVTAMTGPGNPFTILPMTTVIGGVTFPAGTYSTQAFIIDAQITSAKIANLAVDNAKIANLSASKLTIGDGTVGGNLKSAVFSASAGWQIEPGGLATFNNAVVRGTIFASAGTFAGTVTAGGVELGADVGPGAGHSGLSLSTDNFDDVFLRRSDGVKFFRVNGSGANRITFDSSTGDLAIVTPRLNISNGNATFSGALSAATGSFSGALSGATGEFAGTLRAGVLDLSASQGVSTTYGPGTHTVTVPSGRTSMRVTLLGAGGGGGAGQKQNYNYAGGGGGAGGIRRGTFVRSAGEQFTLVVGSGGSGGLMGNGNFGSNVPGNPGAKGGDTILQGFANAGGGAGGAGGPQDSGGQVAAGGAGGAGDPAGLPGNPGSMSTDGNGTPGPGGNGGSSGIYGTGGAGGMIDAGSNGTGSGSGGGGGGYHQSGYDSDIRGGSGTGGLAVIEFFDANGVILRNEYASLTNALQRQNIAIV